MKKFIITLIAVAVLGLTPAVAQHASAEPTAKTENAGKSGKKSPGKKQGKKQGGKKAGKKAAAKQEAAKPAVKWQTAPYMALKTNVAYDALGVINLAYECQIARKWTAELPVMWGFPAWKEDRSLRLAAIQPGVKFWFGEVGTGHAIGADVALGWYNYTWERRRYQNEERPLMGVSLNYAYTLNLGKGWKTEFQLGVGYVNTRYNTYYNIDNGALINTRDRNYFGPTRVGISLVYSL